MLIGRGGNIEKREREREGETVGDNERGRRQTVRI